MSKNIKKYISLCLIFISISICGCIGKKTSGSIVSGKKTIKIGVCESLSSKYEEMGKKGLYGVRYANEKYDTIEIEGEKYKIELVEIDNKSTLDGATDAAKKLIGEKVSFVIGGYGTEACIGMVDVLDKAYIPTIICTNPTISLTNGRYCTYRLCKDDTFVASCMASHIKNKGDSTVAIIYEKDNDYNESFIRYFELACEKMDLSVIKKIMVDKNLKDIRKSLNDIKDTSPEGIYILADRDNAIDIVKNIRDMEISSDISSSDIWEYRGVIDEAGSSAENIDFISFYDKNNTYTQSAYDFINGKGDDKGFVNYLLTNGQEEYVYPESAFAYDAYMIIYNAILTANTTKLEDILKCIDDITYEGVGGVLSFDENGDVRQDKAYIKKIKDGKVENVEVINLDAIE